MRRWALAAVCGRIFHSLATACNTRCSPAARASPGCLARCPGRRRQGATELDRPERCSLAHTQSFTLATLSAGLSLGPLWPYIRTRRSGVMSSTPKRLHRIHHRFRFEKMFHPAVICRASTYTVKFALIQKEYMLSFKARYM